MTPERWKEIELVFSGAFELEGGERDRFVEEHCTGDPELQREVEGLLASLDSAGEYFEELASRIGVPIDPETYAERLVGKRVGNYRLVNLIGRGGMGAVYVAERDDEQFQMKAALKLLPMGLDSDESRRRFLAERQILARLEHPNIARLVDGGVTEDGTPYFVMEHVEGTPIDEYCDTHRLSIPQRLELFLKVCEAVQHAHQNLVVHRDLKPSNILVTESGVVKLLDFGIARVLDSDESGAQTTMTRRTRPMTIAYASPEQILGSSVTTVSDVYTLGVLLYVVLTGRHPYRLGIYTNAIGPNHDWTAHTKAILGSLLTAQGRFTEAETLLLEAHQALGDVTAASEWYVDALTRTVRLYRAWGKPDEAARYQAMIPADSTSG